MTTLLLSHPKCIEHKTGKGHPESPERLKAVLSGLDEKEFWPLKRREAAIINKSKINLVHTSEYVERILDSVPKEGLLNLDADTAVSYGSGEASMRAAGAVVDAIDSLISKEAKNAFCAVRPPGHHAESSRAMGFCIFNSVAIGAYHAKVRHQLDRVAVIDFDVHHGNGTQHSLELDSGMFYGSSHQFPAYPGTGNENETGCANNVANVPLNPGEGSIEFRRAYSDKILPALRLFAPELIIISAGFDAHFADPLAQLEVKTEDYSWVTRRLLEVAGESADGRVVSVLEGGYNLEALRLSSQAHVQALMDA